MEIFKKKNWISWFFFNFFFEKPKFFPGKMEIFKKKKLNFLNFFEFSFLIFLIFLNSKKKIPLSLK